MTLFDRENLWAKKLPSFDDKGEEKEAFEFDLIEKTAADLMKKGAK